MITDGPAAPMRVAVVLREGGCWLLRWRLRLDGYVLFHNDHSSIIVILDDFGRRPPHGHVG